MKKIYYLKTCSTCQRILKEIKADEHGFELQNIKEEAITTQQIEEMHTLCGRYEALFSRTAQKYKSMGLKDKKLTETDYKNLILNEYTFLKRPVTIIDKQIFIGNKKETISAITKTLQAQ